ncbi:hypothetical protein QC820_16415, partial [Halomonas mongoliensis]
MHKKTLCLLMGALFLSSASHASEVDWTPFFKSWEDGCRQSEDFRAFIRGMARSEGDSDFFTLGEVVLPEGYAEAVGDLSLVHQEREYRALRRWVWNSPPELGQDMASTTTGGMAWTA